MSCIIKDGTITLTLSSGINNDNVQKSGRSKALPTIMEHFMDTSDHWLVPSSMQKRPAPCLPQRLWSCVTITIHASMHHSQFLLVPWLSGVVLLTIWNLYLLYMLWDDVTLFLFSVSFLVVIIRINISNIWSLEVKIYEDPACEPKTGANRW